MLTTIYTSYIYAIVYVHTYLFGATLFGTTQYMIYTCPSTSPRYTEVMLHALNYNYITLTRLHYHYTLLIIYDIQLQTTDQHLETVEPASRPVEV